MKIIVKPDREDSFATAIHDGMRLLADTFGYDNAAHISINLLMHMALMKELQKKGEGQAYLDEIAKDLMGSFGEAFELTIKEHPELLDKVREMKERREVS